jgi:hypothetical protein
LYLYYYIKVLDPRLKLQYYADNNWKEYYINDAKRIIINAWTNYYKNNDLVMVVSNKSDPLLNHVFKKQKTQPNDELKRYLGEEVIDSELDVLQWWKVCFY